MSCNCARSLTPVRSRRRGARRVGGSRRQAIYGGHTSRPAADTGGGGGGRTAGPRPTKLVAHDVRTRADEQALSTSYPKNMMLF